MLEAVRRSARSGYSYVLVAALILVFAVSFGVQRQGCEGNQSRRHLADVAGNRVMSDDINVIYNQVYGAQRSGDEAQIQRQRALALKAYIMIELLAQQGRQAGLRVSETEFRNYMKDPFRNPEFLGGYGQSGSWDGQFYKRYVQNLLQVSVPEYEAFKSDELLARKYLNMVESQIDVLPQAVAERQHLKNTQLELNFVKFGADKIADQVTVDDATVAAFEANHADDIQSYYDNHSDQYSDAEQMEVRRIYLEVGKTDADGNSAEDRFKAAQKRLDDGQAFAKVAGEINDALKKTQGLMKMAPVDNMSQTIVDALDDADIGDVRTVKTDTELMLVKLVDRKKAKTTPLSAVRDEIARTLVQQQKVDDLTDTLAQSLLAKAKETGSLSTALAALQSANADQPAPGANAGAIAPAVWSSLSVGNTGEFNLEGKDMSNMFGGQLPPGVNLGRSPWDRIPKIGQSRQLAVDAFKNLTKSAPIAQKVYTVKDAQFVVELASKSSKADADTESSDADGDAADNADSQADSERKLMREIRTQKTGDLVGQWQRLFQRRSRYGASLTMDYGPWLEKQYKQAVDSGTVEFPADASPAAQLIDPNAASPGPSTPAKAGPGQGSPLKVAPSTNGGSSASPDKKPADDQPPAKE